MMPADYYAIVHGYNIRNRNEAERFRTLAFITLMPNLKQGYSYSSFCKEMWPLAGDVIKEDDRVVATEDEIAKIFKAHKIKYK